MRAVVRSRPPGPARRWPPRPRLHSPAEGPRHHGRRPPGRGAGRDTGDDRLATAGTGDVLSGVVGSGAARPAVRGGGGRSLAPRPGRPARGPARPRRLGPARARRGGGPWVMEGAVMSGRPRRGAWVEVDLAAIAINIGVLGGRPSPTRRLWAVVKADGYGHGAVHGGTRRAGGRRRGPGRGPRRRRASRCGRRASTGPFWCWPSRRPRRGASGSRRLSGRPCTATRAGRAGGGRAGGGAPV